MWRAKLCGDIGTEARWQLALDAGEAGLFSQLVALGCGAPVTIEGGLGGLMALGLMADRYQVEAVQGAVEEAALRLLTVESCGVFLMLSSGSGLVRVERESRELALREFDEFARTAGFMEVGEEVLGSLLDDDGLWTESEERVFEWVVRWMKGGGKGVVRGLGLLGKVRYPWMEGKYLEDLSREAGGELAGMEGMVEEALGLKSVARDEWDGQRLRHLAGRVLVGRRGGVRWEKCVGGGERRIAGGQAVLCVSASEGYVCGGLSDGKIGVWSRSTLERERTLTGHDVGVCSLLHVGGRLVSGDKAGDIRVWDVAAGRCEGVLEGHTERLVSLALSGDRLLSASDDGTLKVWRMAGAVPNWPCERTVDGHGSGVWCLAAWEGKAACGCGDGSIRVWSAGTWALEQTLRGHAESVAVRGLVASGRRLISSSEDMTLRVWSTETWGCVQTVQAYPPGSSGEYIHRLAACGPALVGGSRRYSPREAAELRVWDLETLRPLHALRQPAGEALSLMCDRDEVWAAVGREVVVGGRRG